MLVEERCHFLFSARPVFISETQATRMADVVAAIEAVVALPAYQKHVLADEPDIARRNSGGALKRLLLIRVGLPSERLAYSIGMIQIS